MIDTQLAWCAGFLDGEGNFGAYKESSSTAKMRFRIQAAQVEREALDRLEAALGGKVRGPYGPYANNKKTYYQWTVWSAEAVAAIEKIGPYLCMPKLEQIKSALERMN